MSQINAACNFRRLARQWSVFALILVALARRVERLRRAGAKDAHHQAEELEVMSRSALILLTRQMTALPGDTRAMDPSAEDALKQMHTVAIAFMALAMLAMKIRSELDTARLRGGDDKRTALQCLQAVNPWQDCCPLNAAAIALAGGYFDTS